MQCDKVFTRSVLELGHRSFYMTKLAAGTAGWKNSWAVRLIHWQISKFEENLALKVHNWRVEQCCSIHNSSLPVELFWHLTVPQNFTIDKNYFVSILKKKSVCNKIIVKDAAYSATGF